MSGRDNMAYRRGWEFLVRPKRACRNLFDHGPATFNLLAIFLGGIVLFQTWAAVFRLGDHFPTGKIMTVTLILGPLTGLSLVVLGALFAMSLGNLLDRSHRPTYALKTYIPPFPLKNLLWGRIFGRKKISAAFHNPPWRWYGMAWSVCRSRLNWLSANLSGGRTRFGELFSALSGATNVFAVMALIMVPELAWGDGSHFSSAGTGGITSLLLILKAIFALWFLALWYPVLREGFRLPPLRALLAAGISAGLTIGLTLLLLTNLFQLPVFGG